MKRILFFFAVLVLAVSVYAPAPDVNFAFTPTSPTVLSSTLFNPSVTANPILNKFHWSFPDGNINYDYNLIFEDTFSDGSAADWNVVSGVWTAASFYLSSSSLNADINRAGDVNFLDGNYQWNFSYNCLGGTTHQCRTQIARSGGSSKYKFQNDSGVFKLINPAGFAIISGGSFSFSTLYDVNITRTQDGNWDLKINGVSLGTAIDTNATITTTYFYLQNVDTTEEFRLDNVQIIKGAVINADKNESRIFTTTGSKTVCLTGKNASGSETECRTFSVGSFTEAPVIREFDLNYSIGFNVTDLNANYVLKCDSNASSVNYKLVLNGNTVFDSNIAPGTRKYVAVTTVSGSNTATFYCTADVMQDSETLVDVVYFLTFRLVNEKTGNPITSFTDFNAVTMHSFDSNQLYDFKANNKNYLAISSFSAERVRLDVNYSNAVSIYKNYNLGVLSPDLNADICVAQPYQALAEQIFTSSQQDGVVMRHAFSQCYSIADYTSYSYNNVLANRTFTISDPYYLYFFDGNTRIFLTNIDGAVALVHQLQALRLNQTDFDISITTDTVAIAPLFSELTGANVPNVLQIYYKSLKNDNVSLNLKIYNGSTLLSELTDTSTPNELAWDWNFATYGLSDANILRLLVTKTNGNGDVDTFNQYFNISGVAYSSTLNPAVAIMLGLVVLIFGMTIVSKQFAFGWWGVLIGLIAVGLVALAPGFWYLNVFMATCIIILIFNGLVYKNEASKVV